MDRCTCIIIQHTYRSCMLQRGKDATVPFTGDGGALGALTALATQAAVQSNVQQLSWAKEQVPRSMSQVSISFQSNVYSIMFSLWVDGWMDCWQIVKFGLQVAVKLSCPTTFVSWHCSTYCKWFRDQGGRSVWVATDAARAICFPFEFQDLSLAQQ